MRSIIFIGILFLPGCGQPLGEYEVDGIEVVSETRLPAGVRAPNYGRYLKIELSSETSLTAISGQIDAVYAHADFCPFNERYQLTSFGPFGRDNNDLWLPSDAEPLEKGRDGKFHYRVFIVPAHPMQGVKYSKSALEREPYDMRDDGRDVCVRLSAPGYNLIESKSQTIRIPNDQIQAALSSAQ